VLSPFNLFQHLQRGSLDWSDCAENIDSRRVPKFPDLRRGRRRRGRRNPDRSIAAAMPYTFHVSLLVRQARPIRYHHLADLVPRDHLSITVVVLAAIHIIDRRPPLYLLDESLRVEHTHRVSARDFSFFPSNHSHDCPFYLTTPILQRIPSRRNYSIKYSLEFELEPLREHESPNESQVAKKTRKNNLPSYSRREPKTWKKKRDRRMEHRRLFRTRIARRSTG